KAFALDGRFDIRTRKVVRRLVLRPDHADGMPRSVLLRQLASRRVAGEGTQLAFPRGLENIDPHGLGLSSMALKFESDLRALSGILAHFHEEASWLGERAPQ